MAKEYRIKGIEKILESVSKEDLARYFETEQDADFEELITESLKLHNVPNGLEIAGYENKKYEDMGPNGYSGYLQELCGKYTKDGKAAIGLNYPITKNDVTELYFYIDEPIEDKDLETIWGVKTHLSGVSTMGLTMGKGFYERYKDEIGRFQEEYGRASDEQRDFTNYVKAYFVKLSGKEQKEDDEKEYIFDWQRKQAQEKRERVQRTEQLISRLTGGKKIGDVSLQELEQIKQGLEERQKKVQLAFAERFGTKENQSEKE